MINNIKKLLLGNGIGQAIQFASIMILSRIYQPSDFGVLAQIQSIATTAVVIATLQLHLSIPLCKTKDKALLAAKTVQSICVIFFMLFSLSSLFFGKIFFYSALLTLFLGLANIYNNYLVHDGKFGRLSFFYFIRACTIVSLQIGLGLLGLKEGLLFGTIVGECLASVYLRFITMGLIKKFSIDIRACINMIFELKSFSLYGTIQEFISVTVFYAPLFFFTEKFGKDIAGQYAMANRLVWAPIVLFSSSIAQVLYHSFGKNIPEKIKIIGHLFLDQKIMLILFLICVCSFYTDKLFIKFFGAQWVLASHLLPLMLINGSIFLIAIPSRVICRVLHLQKKMLIVDTLIICTIASIFIFLHMNSLYTMWALVIVTLIQTISIAGVAGQALKLRNVRLVS